VRRRRVPEVRGVGGARRTHPPSAKMLATVKNYYKILGGRPGRRQEGDQGGPTGDWPADTTPMSRRVRTRPTGSSRSGRHTRSSRTPLADGCTTVATRGRRQARGNLPKAETADPEHRICFSASLSGGWDFGSARASGVSASSPVVAAPAATPRTMNDFTASAAGDVRRTLAADVIVAAAFPTRCSSPTSGQNPGG